jgi:hypothetical protein
MREFVKVSPAFKVISQFPDAAEMKVERVAGVTIIHDGECQITIQVAGMQPGATQVFCTYHQCDAPILYMSAGYGHRYQNSAYHELVENAINNFLTDKTENWGQEFLPPEKKSGRDTSFRPADADVV